jgi:hypothetical protein
MGLGKMATILSESAGRRIDHWQAIMRLALLIYGNTSVV